MLTSELKKKERPRISRTEPRWKAKGEKKKSFTERLSAKTSPRQCILPGGSRERGVNSLAWMRELNSE